MPGHLRRDSIAQETVKLITTSYIGRRPMRLNYPILSATSTDNLLLVAGGGGSAKTGILNAVDFFEIKESNHQGQLFSKILQLDTSSTLVTSLSISADGSLIAASAGWCCWILEFNQGKKSVHSLIKFRSDFSSQESEQTSVTFIGNVNVLTGGKDSTIRLWKIQRMPCVLDDDSPALDPCVSYPFCKNVDLGSKWTQDTTRVVLMAEFHGHTQRIKQIALDPYSQNLVVSSSEDQKCLLWRITDLTIAYEFTTDLIFQGKHNPIILSKTIIQSLEYCYGKNLFSLLTSPQGSSFLVRWIPGEAPKRGDQRWPWICKAVAPVPSSPCGALAVSRNAQFVATGSSDGEVNIFRSKDLVHRMKCSSHSFAVTSLSFFSWKSNKEMLVSCGADGHVYPHEVPYSGKSFFFEAIDLLLLQLLLPFLNLIMSVQLAILLFCLTFFTLQVLCTSFQKIPNSSIQEIWSNVAGQEYIVWTLSIFVAAAGFFFNFLYSSGCSSLLFLISRGCLANGLISLLVLFASVTLRSSIQLPIEETESKDQNLTGYVIAVISGSFSLGFLVLHVLFNFLRKSCDSLK